MAILRRRRFALLCAAGVAAAVGLTACDTGDWSVRYVVGSRGIILNTTDGGVTWTPQASHTTHNLNWVSFDGSTINGCTVGVGGVILYTTDGSTWNKASSVPASTDLNGVDTEYIPEGDGFDDDVAVGNAGTILTSHDCNTWTAAVSGTTQNLAGVSFCKSYCEDVWAVGDKGTILHSSDFGSTWSPQVSGTLASLEGVFFAGEYGWAVGKYGTILATTDGGSTWTKQSAPSNVSFDSVFFSDDAEHGYIVGAKGVILTTSDGGTTWVKQNSGTTQFLESVSSIYGFEGGGDATTVSGENENPNDWHDAVVAGKDGTILTTTDGGVTWTKQNSGTGKSLAGAA